MPGSRSQSREPLRLPLCSKPPASVRGWIARMEECVTRGGGLEERWKGGTGVSGSYMLSKRRKPALGMQGMASFRQTA
jgi:hypothetical protein